MKKLILLLFIACSVYANGQQVREWLALSPIEVQPPVFAQVKNVNNQLFTAALLPDFSGINISALVPDENRNENLFKGLTWGKASLTEDTVITAQSEQYTLNYYAAYLSNTDWMKGNLEFTLFGPAEIYLDGNKKTSYTDTQRTTRSITSEFIPGKHTIIVKTTGKGGKAFAAAFKADKAFAGSNIDFSVSPKRGMTIYDILDGEKTERITVSPTGRYTIASNRETINGISTFITNVYRLADREIVYSFHGQSANSIQWHPSMDKVSFLVREGSGNSLYLYDIGQQQQQCLVKADKQLTGYTWSPDASYLIYYASDNFSEDNLPLRKLSGIEDRQSYYRYRSYLCKFDLNTGLHTRLTWGNLSTSLMDISHDGDQILFATSSPDYTEYPYRKQSVYLLNIKSMQLDTIWKDLLFSVNCTFSPDDKQLLVSGGPSAFGKTGENIGKDQIANQYDGQLYIYDLTSRHINPITRNFNPAVASSFWHKDGNIYLTATDADYVHLFRYSPTDNKITRIECPGDVITGISIATQGNSALYLASDINYPARIFSLNLGNLNARLWENPAKEQFENIVFGDTRDWNFNYKKGTTITGRYYLPVNFDPAKKYPLIVYYYGGTTPVDRAFGTRWPLNLFAANGYVVYVMQPSGANGFGQEFSARHQNNWGKITADEIITSSKAFIKAHPFVDGSKVGCMGASYGGFTTMYLTTRTDLFTCAIAHAGISSIAGYWGEGYWGYSYGTNSSAYAFPWNRKDIYVDQSPLFNADKVKSPILLIHGTKDVNVPTGESIQFYNALKLLGKDTDLVLVKDADHAVVNYDQRILWNNTILAYLAKYLKNQPAWWQDMYKDKNL